MQQVFFAARCPFELGDYVQVEGVSKVITDIACIHYARSGKVEFFYQLDGEGYYTLEKEIESASRTGGQDEKHSK